MNKVFIRSLPVVAMAMGDKMGVKVRIQGSQAMTDGNTIYLPVLPEGDESAWILARGYLDHEAGHVRHTDFSVREDTPIHKALANILEDIRIEQAMGWTYPGCAVNLRNLANHLAYEGAFTPSANKPEQLFLGWILAECRSHVLKQSALVPVAQKARKSLVKRLGVVLVNQTEALLKRVESLSTTRQAHDLAEEILDRLRQAQNQRPQKAASQTDKKKSEEQPTPSPESKSDKQGNDAPEDSSMEESPSGSDNDTDITEGSRSSPAASKETLKRILGKDPGAFGDLGQMTAEALQAASDQAVRENGMESMTGIYPGEQLAKEVTCGNPPDLHQVRHETVALRSKLARLVQASKLKRSCAGRLGRLVDHRTLHRLPAGDPRVFRRKEEKRAINTAVIVLLDRSGSMSGARMELARKTVLALADVLGVIPGISVSTGAFPGKEGAVVSMTPFGRTASQTKDNYAITANGGTPLAQALGWARVQMAVRQEQRKILLVATDGQPSNPGLVRALLEKLEAEGVELMGLGILDQGTTRHFFARHRTVQSLSELPAAVFELFQEALTE
ncbi:MAG: VWA domain-containing protein [Desulfuromonadales bacterium]|nr:VWA domain-containing protein [Desulfuromonadales bacterium]